MKRRIERFLPLLCSLVLLTGCAASSGPAAEPVPAESAAPAESEVRRLRLDAADSLPEGVRWEDGVFTLAEAGVYQLSGAREGQLIVEADGPVELVLEGVSLTGPRCLDIRSESPVILTAAAGTENTLSAGGEEGSPALASKAPLTLSGEGSIAVLSETGDGVRCKSDLTTEVRDLRVSAGEIGLSAKGTLTVSGGSISVQSGGDGLASEGGRRTGGDILLLGGALQIDAGGRGLDGDGAVSVTGGSLSLRSVSDGIRGGSVDIAEGELGIDAGRDGIQAETRLTVSGGVLELRTGGGGGNAASHPGESFGPWAQASAEETESSKGLKSGGSIDLTGGSIRLDTADDGIHCAEIFTLDGSDVSIVAYDDAVHADDMLIVQSGSLRIEDCFEGLEAFAVEVRGGDVFIRAVNDGVNANGSEMMFMGPGASGEATQEAEPVSASGSSVTYFLMSGGKLDLAVTGSMSNMGDGVDSNGAVYITGGELLVSTYGSFMENGLDTGWGGPVVTGGVVLAGGSATMAESFSEDSTQCCAVITTSYMPDGTEVTLLDAAGSRLWSATLADGFTCLQFSHPAMTPGNVYTLVYGESSTELDFTSTTNIRSSRGFGGPGGRPF